MGVRARGHGEFTGNAICDSLFANVTTGSGGDPVRVLKAQAGRSARWTAMPLTALLTGVSERTVRRHRRPAAPDLRQGKLL